MPILFAVLWLLALAGLPANAQTGEQKLPPAAVARQALPPTAAFAHLTIDQGLANQTATEIAQDAEGFMWIGTFNGLDRFDGYQFTHYRHDDSDPYSLSGNIITALFADREGAMGRSAPPPA